MEFVLVTIIASRDWRFHKKSPWKNVKIGQALFWSLDRWGRKRSHFSRLNSSVKFCLYLKLFLAGIFIDLLVK